MLNLVPVPAPGRVEHLRVVPRCKHVGSQAAAVAYQAIEAASRSHACGGAVSINRRSLTSRFLELDDRVQLAQAFCHSTLFSTVEPGIDYRELVLSVFGGRTTAAYGPV